MKEEDIALPGLHQGVARVHYIPLPLLSALLDNQQLGAIRWLSAEYGIDLYAGSRFHISAIAGLIVIEGNTAVT